MTFQQLAVELCKREGKKKQVDIAQMSEILKNLCKILAEDPPELVAMRCLLKQVTNASKKNKKNKREILCFSISGDPV